MGIGNPVRGVPVVLPENIPGELKVLKQWCLWKADKIPVTLEGAPLSSTNEGQWEEFDDCLTEYVCSTTNKVKGIGFVFKQGGGIVGIDLDHAIESGVTKPWAKKVLSLFERSYTEISPSGTGLHILVCGRKPGPKCKKVVLNSGGTRIGEIEMYDHARYFTITGNLYSPDRKEMLGQQDGIDVIYKRVIDLEDPIKKAPEQELKGRESVGHEDRSEAGSASKDIISLIMASSQAGKYQALTTGPLEQITAPYGGDHSRAIYALTGLLAFYTADYQVIDLIMRQSPLYDGKWAAGKWQRLGQGQFDRQRSELVSKGNIYEAGQRSSPSEDFSEAEGNSEKSKGELEYERHIDLLSLHFSDTRKDLLSNALHGLHNGQGWVPVFNRSILGALKGECQARGKLYKKAKMEDYLYRYEQSLQPKLLIDVPAWDGLDRIGEMCDKLALSGVSPVVFKDAYKDWCAKLWGKIVDPMKTQNRCVILSGQQGIGKDEWVKAQFNALGRYFSDLTLAGAQSKETDIAVTMSSSLVMFISEFDKTSEIGVETLKEMVTKATFSFVRKYDRESSTLVSRCSLIGACNPSTVLRDVTGNRRFLVFKLAGGPREAILWDYPRMDKDFSLQVVAQCKNLFEAGYKTTEATEQAIAELTKRYTPDDANEEVLIDFEMAIDSMTERDVMNPTPGLYKLDDLVEVLDNIARNHGLPRKVVLSLLKAQGCQLKTRTQRVYGTRKIVAQGLKAEPNENELFDALN